MTRTKRQPGAHATARAGEATATTTAIDSHDYPTPGKINHDPADRQLIAELLDLLSRHTYGTINAALWDIEQREMAAWRNARNPNGAASDSDRQRRKAA
jgi:hypothetical protein